MLLFFSVSSHCLHEVYVFIDSFVASKYVYKISYAAAHTEPQENLCFSLFSVSTTLQITDHCLIFFLHKPPCLLHIESSNIL